MNNKDNILNINRNQNFFKIFFIFFPLFLISGSFLSDLSVVVIASYFVFYFYLNKKYFFFKNKLIIFFFIFYLYININSFFAYLPLVSLSSSLPYIRLILFSIFVGYLLTKISNLKKIIFFSFLTSYLILFIDSLIQLKLGVNVLGYQEVDNRISSLFRDKLVMGSYVSRTLPILIAISYFENFKNVNFLRLFCILLTGCLVFFSAERVSIFFYISTVIIYLILLPNKFFFFSNLILLIFTLFLLDFLKPSSTHRIYKHTINQIYKEQFFFFSERHQMHYITAYRMFLERKFLGHGIKSFRYLCHQEPYSTKDVLINNNRNFSPISGYYYLIKDSQDVFYIKDAQKSEFDMLIKNLEESKKSNNLADLMKAENNFSSFQLRENLTKIENKNIILYTIKSPSKVSKGDYTYSSNEHNDGCNTHPHSSHLQILSELGLFGYVFFFFFFSYLIFIFSKKFLSTIFKKVKGIHTNYNIYIIFIILALIQDLLPLIPTGNIFNNWLSIFFYFKLAFFLNFHFFDRKCSFS